jgi:hypothetical protein
VPTARAGDDEAVHRPSRCAGADRLRPHSRHHVRRRAEPGRLHARQDRPALLLRTHGGGTGSVDAGVAHADRAALRVGGWLSHGGRGVRHRGAGQHSRERGGGGGPPAGDPAAGAWAWYTRRRFAPFRARNW